MRQHYLEGPRYQEPNSQAPAAVSDGFQSADSRNHAGQGDGSKLGNQGAPRSTKGPYEFGFGSLGRVRLDPQGNVSPSGPVDRPEEPAKYISEIPKLVQADLSVSAVVCGNWLARVKQIFQGLSPNAHEWFSAVESAATENYNKWLVADPVERLLLDPGSVVAVFDAYKFQQVESRAVSLLLASIPPNLEEELVSNRWMSTSSILYRVLCMYQPGGSSERAYLLSQLVGPESVKTFSQAVSVLRKWTQNLSRAKEIHATLPDPSLLLKGIDSAVSGLLAQHPMIAFRVNSFRHKQAVDYNPTVSVVIQLVRLIQAECEASSLTTEVAQADKRPRNAALNTGGKPDAPHNANPSQPSQPQPNPNLNPGQSPSAKTTTPVPDAPKGAENPKGKGKGKGKGKDGGDQGPCVNFNESRGCRFGDTCRFKHDRATARKQRRCLACGLGGHFRPECPLVPPEHRQVVSSGDANSASPKAAAKASAKALATPPNPPKGVTEDTPGTVGRDSATSVAGDSRETLLAEAAKILKGVSLKPLKVLEGEWDEGELHVTEEWLFSAISGVSDQRYALVDSGATNAL